MNLSLFGKRRKGDTSKPSSSWSNKATNGHSKGLSSSLPPSSVAASSFGVPSARPRHASHGTAQHQQPTTSGTIDAVTDEFGALQSPSRHPQSSTYTSGYTPHQYSNAASQTHGSSYAAFAQDFPSAADKRVHRRMSTGSIPKPHDASQQIVHEELQVRAIKSIPLAAH